MRWAWLALPAVIWGLGTLLFVAQAGKYSDDYHITMRDLATGEIRWELHPWSRWSYFWRPLHLALVFFVGTAFWEHDWVGRVFSALVHLGVASLLGLWLARLGVSRRPTVAACVIFLAHPFHSEALHWFSAVSTAVACLPLLIIFDMIRRRARGHHVSRTQLPLLFVLSFATACFYESTAAALGVVPLIHLACRPRAQRWSLAVRRAVAPTAVCGAACLLYVALLAWTAPPGQRGSPTMLPSSGGVLPRFGWFLREWGIWLWGPRGRGVWAGSFTEGWAVLSQGVGWVWLAMLALGAGAFVVAWRSERDPTAALSPPASDQPSPRWLLLIGVVIFFLAWLPVILVKDNSVELRLWYTPLLGLAIAFAGLVECLVQPTSPSPLARFFAHAVGTLVLVITLSAGIAGAIGQVGFQAVFRRVFERDQQQAARLREFIPNPPPGLIVVPIRNNSVAGASGWLWFDHALQGGLGEPWSSSPMIQRALRTRSAFATFASGWPGRSPPLTHFEERGVWSSLDISGDFQRGSLGTLLPWDRVVPVVITRKGDLLAVRRLTIESPDGSVRSLDMPLVQSFGDDERRIIRATVRNASPP